MTNSIPAACIVGWPVKHSRSPLIHNYWIKLHGLKAEYRREEIEPAAFSEFITHLPMHGYVGANITIGNLAPLSRHGMVRGGLERSSILTAMRALNVKASSPQAVVTHLSGGNQQKLLFARVLMRAPKVLLLDEPTKGVDAATRHEIYRLVVELAEKGVALLIVASELEELIGLCDRCLVVADGRIVDEFGRGEGGEDRVLRSVTAAQAERHAVAAQVSA